MALSNYTELQAEVADWLHRTDSKFVAKVPLFISLAETHINRVGRVRAMENEVPLAMSVGSRFVALPDGFSAPQAVFLESVQPRVELGAAVPETLPVTTSQGMPCYWCIDGEQIAFDRPADQAYSITLRQVGGFTLSDDAPTNALLTKYPDVYLFGAQMQAALYIRNTDLAAQCKGLFDQAIREMNQTESRSRSVAPLRTEVAQMLCRR